MVVDVCDSHHGRKDNIVETSAAVWMALGHDTSISEVVALMGICHRTNDTNFAWGGASFSAILKYWVQKP
jgi:hypothetical protein